MKRTLSPRQAEIMREICAGLLTKEIADKLAINRRTVQGHIDEAKKRMLARTLAQAAVVFITTRETVLKP